MSASKWKIPLYKILVDRDDIKVVSRVIERGMDWAIGPEIEEFERSFAEYLGSNYCLALNSGTSALHASLIAIDSKSGDEIIVPSFTFIATPNSALMVNATPRFVDIEDETLGLNPNEVEKSISKKTKAIIPIHYAGLPCKIADICNIAKQKKIWVVEDAAESLGAKIDKKMTGTYGDLSVFSFAGNKILTTGEGGAITTNSKQLYEKLKLIRSHGRKDKHGSYFSSVTKPDYVQLGYNWRMSSISAALALSQLNKIEKLIQLRRKNADYISSRLRKIKEIKIPNGPSGHYHVYQFYSIRLPTIRLRNKLMQFLAERGIMSKVFFDPIHLTTFYKQLIKASAIKLRITELVSEQILSLPMYPSLKHEEMDYICDSIEEFMENHS